METTLRTARNWGLGFLVFFNILDIITTYVALHHGAAEGNPVTSAIIGAGFGWVIFWKFLVLAILAFALSRTQAPLLYTTLAMWTVTGAYLMVVMINLATLHRLV